MYRSIFSPRLSAIALGLMMPVVGLAQGGIIANHLDLAKKFDPTFLSAISSREAAEQGIRSAESMLGPKVSLSVSAFRNNRVEESRNFLGESVDISRRFDTQNAVVQARQPLYRKRELLGVDQARAQEAAAGKVLLFAEQDLQLRLASAWLEVLSARALVSIFADAYLAAQEFLAEIDRWRVGGEATVQDVAQARARVIQFEALLEDARSRVAVADQSLTLIVGPGQTVPDGLQLGFFSELSIGFRSEGELIERVRQSNYEIASSQLQEEAARLEREKSRADRLPVVDAIASATRGQNDSLNFIKDEQRFGVQMTVPLYTHGAIESSVAQADANYRRLQSQTQAITFRAQTEAVSAFNALRSLQSRIRAVDRLAEAAEELLKSQQLGVRAGINSRGEVARSMTDRLTAQRDRVLARKEYAAAWLKLQSATGSLDAPSLQAVGTKMASAANASSLSIGR